MLETNLIDCKNLSNTKGTFIADPARQSSLKNYKLKIATNYNDYSFIVMTWRKLLQENVSTVSRFLNYYVLLSKRSDLFINEFFRYLQKEERDYLNKLTLKDEVVIAMKKI